MKTSMSLLLVTLLAACASQPVPLDQPIVVALDWQQAPFDVRPENAVREKQLRNHQRALELLVRDHFSTVFRDVTVVRGTEAAQHATRVDLKISELATVRTSRQRLANEPDPGLWQRCGTVEYVVYIEGKATARQDFALDCGISLLGLNMNDLGTRDYDKAARRAVAEVARAMRRAS